MTDPFREAGVFESNDRIFGGRSASGFSRPTVALGIKKEWSGLASPSVWDVKGHNLKLLSLDFPLERTHREIWDDVSQVAKRISDSLRVLSIETEFDNQKAKAKCRTNDCVCFRIRLYAGSESAEPVIVELQRRNGSAASFMCTCRAILNAAEGKTLVPKQSLRPFQTKPINQMKCLQSVSAPVLMAHANPLNKVMGMLRSTKRDSNVLGFENLCSLTDPSTTFSVIAFQISREMILNDDLRQEIYAFTEQDVDFSDDDGLVRHTEQVRNMALTVFANALSVCRMNGCLMKAIEEDKWFVERLIPSLLNELQRFEFFTNSACKAACCVQSLMACSDVSKEVVVAKGGVAIFKQAYDFGTRRHAELASETSKCLNMVDI